MLVNCSFIDFVSKDISSKSILTVNFISMYTRAVEYNMNLFGIILFNLIKFLLNPIVNSVRGICMFIY